MSASERPAPFPYDFAAVGVAVRVVVSGAVLHMRPSGALWLERDRTLVVADLHLEKGSAYASRGQLLPPYDTRETLRRLAEEVAQLDPLTIVMLGDAFHDGGAEDRLSLDDARAVHRLAHRRTLVWVVGNHDPSPPESLPGDSVDELELAGLALRHEPVAGPSPREAAGHLHPCARIVAGGRSVRRRCFVTDGERLVLPAFGGLFARPPLAVALGSRRAHAVGWWSVAGD